MAGFRCEHEASVGSYFLLGCFLTHSVVLIVATAVIAGEFEKPLWAGAFCEVLNPTPPSPEPKETASPHFNTLLHKIKANCQMKQTPKLDSCLVMPNEGVSNLEKAIVCCAELGREWGIRKHNSLNREYMDLITEGGTRHSILFCERPYDTLMP